MLQAYRLARMSLCSKCCRSLEAAELISQDLGSLEIRKGFHPLTERWLRCVFGTSGCGSRAARRCSPVRPASWPVQSQLQWRSRGADVQAHLTSWYFCAIANPSCYRRRHLVSAISSGTACKIQWPPTRSNFIFGRVGASAVVTGPLVLYFFAPRQRLLEVGTRACCRIWCRWCFKETTRNWGNLG